MRTLSSHRTDLSRPSRRGLVLLLVLALLLAQALGLMHRTLHGGAVGAAAVAVVGAPAQADAEADPRGHAHGWVVSLFPNHASDADCRLFDPLHHDGMPTVAVLVLPLLLTSFFLVASTGDFVARWAALFDARGPPSPR